jgi:hypothetical protein
MSSFVKPYNYIDGIIPQAINQEDNEEALKHYVNQEIIAGDIDNDSLSGDNIVPPRFISVVNNADFCSKTVQGISKIRNPQQYNYFTSTTKNYNQTSTTIIDYQSIPNTGAEVNVPSGMTAIVLITCYLKAYCFDNIGSIAAGGSGNGMWASQVQLQQESNGIKLRYPFTNQWAFEGTGTALGVRDPGAQGNAARNRALYFSRQISLTEGDYKFCMIVNPNVEKGHISSQSFIIETFYI